MSVNSDIEKTMKRGYNILDKQLLKNEKKLIRIYKQSLKEIKAEIAGLYEKMGKVNLAESTKYNRLSNMAIGIQDELTRMGVKSKAVVIDSIKTAYSETYNFTGYAVENGLGVDLGFAPLPHDKLVAKNLLNGRLVTQDGVIQDPFDLIKWKSSVTKTVNGYNTKIKDTLTKGLIKGDSYQSISKQIGEIGGKNASQMMRILRTEGGRASSKGYLEAYNEIENDAASLGIGMKNKWLSTLDSKTRDTHQTLDQQIAVAENEGEQPMFTSNGNKAPAPRTFGIAAEDINCRCNMTPEVEGLEDSKYRKARDESGKSVLVKNQTYSEWAKSKGIKTNLAA